jgi:hypothetical protein
VKGGELSLLIITAKAGPGKVGQTFKNAMIQEASKKRL